MRTPHFDPNREPKTRLEILRAYWWMCRRLGVAVPPPAAYDAWDTVLEVFTFGGMGTPAYIVTHPPSATWMLDCLTRGSWFAMRAEYAADWLDAAHLDPNGDDWVEPNAYVLGVVLARRLPSR